MHIHIYIYMYIYIHVHMHINNINNFADTPSQISAHAQVSGDVLHIACVQCVHSLDCTHSSLTH